MLWRRSDGDLGRPVKVDDRPTIAELVRRLIDDARRLIRTEVAAAKAELSGKALEAAKPVGVMAAGAALLFGAFLSLLAAAVAGLASLIGSVAFAALIVAIVCGAGGAALILNGKKQLAATSLAPTRLTAALKEDAAALKGDRP